jgi:hypothetical protein
MLNEVIRVGTNITGQVSLEAEIRTWTYTEGRHRGSWSSVSQEERLLAATLILNF